MACLVALVLAALAWIPFSLADHVSFNLGPDALQARARELIRDLGYPDRPNNRAWWIGTDDAYVDRLNRLRPSEALAEIGAARPGPLIALLMIGYGYLGIRGGRPATMSPLLLLAMAGVFWLLLVWVLWKHGAFALAVAFFAGWFGPSHARQ